FGGTARAMSMAGSFGALGADFSNISANPAGLGLYKKSEFMLSPGFWIGKTESNFNGSVFNDSKHNFNLSNLGIVIVSPTRKEGASIVKNFQFAIGHNRTNNFNNRMLSQGYNDQSSIVHTFIDNANGIQYEDIYRDDYGMYTYDLNPAWMTYMIDTIPGFTDSYMGSVPEGSNILQRKEVESWGAMNEFSMAFSANLAERVYLGAAFAFPTIRYNELSRYSEIDEMNEIDDFRQLSIYDDLQTTGSGFNMKFGMIIRATDWLRVGGAVHSPTWYNNMKDYWYSEFTSEFDNNDVIRSTTPHGTYNYTLETPWKLIGNASFIVGHLALISAEYEYVNYAESRLRGSQYNFYDENLQIKTKYSETHNIRLGTEFRFGHVAVRGGLAYYMSPFTDNINNGEKFFYTGGFGFRDKNFFVDFAYVRSASNEDYYFYGSENVDFNPVKNKYISNNLALTLGLRY
ncbi:MAG: outer membrane protein transport protein, partial [Ignavibacteriales bacterium]|nr:outer membrane protein transport protein [Ignavibacteriales bacterium]